MASFTPDLSPTAWGNQGNNVSRRGRSGKVARPPRCGADGIVSRGHAPRPLGTDAIPTCNGRAAGRRIVVRIRPPGTRRSLASIPSRDRYLANAGSGEGGSEPQQASIDARRPGRSRCPR